MSELIRYESGQRGRYIYEGREFLWDISDDPIKIIARGPQDQESLQDSDFTEQMLENLFYELDIVFDEISFSG